MSNQSSKLLIDVDTLRALASDIGTDRLLEEIEAAGLSRFTAKEMLKGNYQKEPRGCTRKALVERLRKYGMSEATLFTRYKVGRMVKAS